MAVTFDGSFILPAIEQFKNINNAVDRFNDFFGRILLGGIYTQSIDATYIQKCLVYFETNYFKTIGVANNAFGDLKNSFRHKHASVKDNIILHNTNHIYMRDILDAYKVGSEYLNTITNLTASILSKGVTSYVNHSYPESLTYNWVSIEQILDFIWQKKFIEKKSSKIIAGRLDFLKDTRSWTSANRIEMFYQRRIIDETLYENLSQVRKARNKFIHTGFSPSKNSADIAIKSLFQLISLVFTDYKSKQRLGNLLKKYVAMDSIERTFYKPPSKINTKDVKAWYDSPIPKIPGDEKWNEQNYKYSIGYDFMTKLK